MGKREGGPVNWSGIKVLVTGAAGFIGSHLTEALVRRGARVRPFVRYHSTRNLGWLAHLDPAIQNELNVFTGDLCDAEAVSQAMRGTDIVFHLGALISIPYSYAHPREVVETNVGGTLNILTAARDLGVAKVIHTSSSEVYGTARYAPIDEAHPLQGQSPYAASKIGADKLAESFFCSYGLPVVVVRPFNAYGPRQSLRAVIPTVLVQALSADRIRLGDLSPKRDFTFVEDTVRGFLRAAEVDEAVGDVFNIGSGKEISIADLVREVLVLTGKDLPVEQETQRLRPARSEVRRLWADASKAEAVLGWRPEVSLQEGLTRTLRWIVQHLDRFPKDRYVV
ncbi:MAG: SDR family NAD(P)-dependent oxidoreductase [Alicyclobacillaceae bacterium]|nr:SDR family NAD(P)-dependent oxidoreductase [Alicyclobacillaceae bacterium]